jgi:hypothetical protein
LTPYVFINICLRSSGREIVKEVYMSGEIDVGRMMEFMRRQRGMSEWNALKEYWRASEEDKPVVRFLYGKVLDDGLVKYNQRFLK